MAIWWILLAAAFFVLFFLGRGGPNAIGGTATLGTLIGVGIALYQPGFDWWIVGKAVIIGTFVGLLFEWLPVIFGAARPEKPE